MIVSYLPKGHQELSINGCGPPIDLTSYSRVDTRNWTMISASGQIERLRCSIGHRRNGQDFGGRFRRQGPLRSSPSFVIQPRYPRQHLAIIRFSLLSRLLLVYRQCSWRQQLLSLKNMKSRHYIEACSFDRQCSPGAL